MGLNVNDSGGSIVLGGREVGSRGTLHTPVASVCSLNPSQLTAWI